MSLSPYPHPPFPSGCIPEWYSFLWETRWQKCPEIPGELYLFGLECYLLKGHGRWRLRSASAMARSWCAFKSMFLRCDFYCDKGCLSLENGQFIIFCWWVTSQAYYAFSGSVSYMLKQEEGGRIFIWAHIMQCTTDWRINLRYMFWYWEKPEYL